jgi:citrate synthase
MIEAYIKKNNIALSKRFEIALEVERVCEELLSAKGVYPNVDFYSGILYAEIFKIPRKHFTPIFAMARSSGWVAHWHEQVRHNRIFRPTQIYTGAGFRDYHHSSNHIDWQQNQKHHAPCFVYLVWQPL